MSEGHVSVDLVQQDGYRFEARFDQPAIQVLVTDEPPPLGTDSDPNPSCLLCTSIANWLSTSLLFALSKF